MHPPNPRRALSIAALLVGLVGCGRDPGTPASEAKGEDTQAPSDASVDTPTGWVRGPQDAGRAGIAVVALADRDGDGRADWAVSASAVGEARQGAVWTGGGLPEGERDLADSDALARGEREIERLGQSMAAVGDLDGDGLSELALGGIHIGEPRRMHGGVRLLWGGTDAVTTLEADGMMEHAGWAVAGATVGAPRVLVGTPYRRTVDDALDARGFPEAVGRVYILDDFRDGAMAERAAAVLEGEASWAAFGAALAGTDLNGDGVGDVCVGSPNAGSGAGSVAWFAGPLAGTRTLSDADAVWEGEAGDHLGFSIAADGDVDGDGMLDAAIGAYKAGVERDDTGAVVLIDGASLQISGRLDVPQAEALAGTSVAFRALSSGRSELLVGAPGWRVEGQRAGAVFRHQGPVDGASTLRVATALLSPAPQAEFGRSISAGADLDGDGSDDAVVGAPGWDTDDGKLGAALFFAMGAE
jgi:hypothetical protein